jgi:hypothetical protein
MRKPLMDGEFQTLRINQNVLSKVLVMHLSLIHYNYGHYLTIGGFKFNDLVLGGAFYPFMVTLPYQ